MAAAVAGLALVLMVAYLLVGVASGEVAWGRLFTSGTWDPVRGRFGAAAMIWGTAAVAGVAVVVAAPIGWGAAVAVNELVPAPARRRLRAGAEVLAVVPSVVYGLVGVAYIRPVVARLAGVPGGDSLLAAGLVLAVMVLPTVIAVSIDALAAVPEANREAASACGLRRMEVIGAAVLPLARRGMGAAVLLALARALGETIAVFLLVGRADGRLPVSPAAIWRALPRPGQTLTTKLNGPESILAGTSGPHWAALCALGLILLAGVVILTLAGRAGADSHAPPASRGRVRPVFGARRERDVAGRLVCLACLAVPIGVAAAVLAAAVARGGAALRPSFWWTAATGASGGGIRGQLVGTLLVVAAAGVMAAPVGFALGLVMSEYASPRVVRALRSLTLTMAGIPSILLGLWAYWLFSIRLGWGKSWLSGAIALAVVVVPPVAVATLAAARSLPAERREAALASGFRPDQVVRSVVVPHAAPGLVTGLLLGIARAAGETAPLLFTAAVFSGAPAMPTGVVDSPVVALPVHIFTLAQDAADPAALRTAWASAVALIAVAGLAVVAAIPARRRTEAVHR